jgi:hypothetical protein
LSVRLTGVDFSAAAVEIAARRSGDFVAADRAEFRRGTFELLAAAVRLVPRECGGAAYRTR